MRRREFISFIGGAAAWPITVGAQQSDRMRRVGLLTGQRPEDAENKARRAAFEQRDNDIKGRFLNHGVADHHGIPH